MGFYCLTLLLLFSAIKLLHSDKNVKGCDASGLNRYSSAWFKEVLNVLSLVHYILPGHLSSRCMNKKRAPLQRPFIKIFRYENDYNFLIIIFLNHTSSPCSCKEIFPLLNLPKPGMLLNLLIAIILRQLSSHSLLESVCCPFK
jgi:hypothetical protein